MSEFKDFTVTYTVEDIYYQGVPTIPAGYTAEFRLPKKGEAFINKFLPNHIFVVAGDNWRIVDGPRLVLTPIRRKVITFVETGEVRPPKVGEWYQTKQCMIEASWDYITPCIIYTRTESFQ